MSDDFDPVEESDLIVPHVQDDPNSREALARSLDTQKGVRRDILFWLRDHDGRTLTCSETHRFHPHGKHQATSAAINALWNEGLIIRVGRRKNSEGNNEYEYDLSRRSRDAWGMGPGRSPMPGEPGHPKTPPPNRIVSTPTGYAAVAEVKAQTLALDTAPAPEVAKPTTDADWYCGKCGSPPASLVVESFGGYGDAHCRTCGKRTVFRQRKTDVA